MTTFTIHARRVADGVETTFSYDNQTSMFLRADGTPVIPSRPMQFGDAEVVSVNQPGRKGDIKTLKISLGLSCNYECGYCSQRFVPHAEQTNPGDVGPFIGQLTANLPSAPGRIEFWGGEPFVYWKTLKPLAEALRALYPAAHFNIITNGSLLDLDKNAWLEQIGFSVGLSHDGPGYHARGADPLDDPEKLAAIMDLWTRLKPLGRMSVTYVVEFMLGRYCATTNEAEIQEGLSIVQRQLSERTVRAGNEALIHSIAKEKGQVKIIDIISARLDAKTDSYVAELPSLKLRDVRISAALVTEHQRMLTGGFYAEVTLGYDPAIAQEKGGRAFGVDSLRAIQLSQREVLDKMAVARAKLTTAEWKDFLLRSIGLEPAQLTERNKDAILMRMVPFVERNYNMVEIGPRGTGKSHLFQQVSPYAHLVSGGKATVARMFVNNANGQRGLVCQYDVVCFDEVSGISFDQKDGVNIMKGYMESGEFSRGKESIRADGSIVMVGNFDIDVEHQQRIGHLFQPLPPEMRDDTAFMDRIHCYLPGWDVPKLKPEVFTDHFGLVSDFLSECFTQLRNQSRLAVLQNRVFFGGALSGRDINGVNKTISGLLKLIHPGQEAEVSDEDLEWAVRLALEVRRRVKEQQKRIGAAEFRNTHFSYTLGAEGVEKFVSTQELQSHGEIGDEPLEAGQIWTLSPGGPEEHPGLFRLEVSEGPGSGVRVLNKPVPAAFQESIRCAEQNLYARAMQLVGDRDPRSHEFSVQLRGFDAAKTGAKTGVASLIALCGALLRKSVRGGLVVVGEVTLGGTIEPNHNAVSLAEIAVEKGAQSLLLPVSCRRQLFDLSDDMATKLDIEFYQDAKDALLKALAD